jgi:rhomboid protease GluP
LEFSPVTRYLILMNVVMYVVGQVGTMFNVPGLDTQSLLLSLGLFPESVVREGMLWTPFTYMFLHANLLHLGMNMMGLYLLGPDLELAFGKRNYLLLYLVAGLLGGLGFVGVSYGIFGHVTPCVGASGAIMGLLGAIVAIYPRRVYVIFPLMIPLKATVLAVILLTTHLFFMFTPYGGRVAYDVHVFGGLAGYLMSYTFSFLHRREWRDAFPATEVPYACVELETLAYQLARAPEEDQSPETWSRYHQLRQALRFEDVPSVEELRATRS